MTPSLAALLQQIVEVLGPHIWGVYAVFLRVGAAMALLPAFGEQAIPVRVRLVLTLAFTAITYPAVADGLAAVTAKQSLIALPLITESIAGLVLGIGLRLMVHVLQIAGMIIAQSLSLSQMFGVTGEPQPAVGHLLTVSGLALAVMSGLHLRLAEALIMSYELIPAGSLPLGEDLRLWGVNRISSAFSLAFSLSVPFVLASALYNLALGFINRAMPQLMVAMVGAPALTLGGLALLMLATPAVIGLWHTALLAALSDPLGLLP